MTKPSSKQITHKIGSITKTVDIVLDELLNNQQSSSSGITNLSVATSASSVTIKSDTGTDATIPLVSQSLAGVMSPTDKTQLDQLSQYAIFSSTNSNYSILGNDQYGVTNWQTIDNTTSITTNGTTFNLPIGVWQINLSVMIVGTGVGISYIKNDTAGSVLLIGTKTSETVGGNELSLMSNGSSIIKVNADTNIRINIATQSQFVPGVTLLSPGHFISFHKLK